MWTDTRLFVFSAFPVKKLTLSNATIKQSDQDKILKTKTGACKKQIGRHQKLPIFLRSITNEKELEKFVKMLNSGKIFIARKTIPISKKLCYKNAIFCEDYYFDKFMKKNLEL